MNASQSRLGVLAFGTGLAVAVLRGSSPFEEVDTWWHLRVGQHILDGGALVGPDPWATFADRPYTATQWLPEAFAAWLVGQLGTSAVVWMRGAALVAIYLALYLLCRQVAGRLPASLAASLALLGAGGGLNPRPQLVSFVLFAVVLLAWWRTLADGRPRWWLLPVFWLWGCCHPLWMFGLVVGAVLTAFAVFGPTRAPVRRLLLLNVGCVVALAVTPLGPRALLTPLDVAGNAAWIAEEWRATPLNNIFSVAAVGMLVITALLWVRSPRRRPLWHYALLALALGFTLWMWRLVPLGCIIGAPLFADALQERLARPVERLSRREGRRVALAGVLAVAVAGGLAASAVGQRGQTYPGRTVSVDRALDALPPGTMVLNDFGVSGWLLWRHPTLRPVVDLRVEIYPAQHLRDYIRTENVRPGWEDLITRTGARVAVMEVKSPLADALEHRLGWRVVTREGRFVVLEAPAP